MTAKYDSATSNAEMEISMKVITIGAFFQWGFGDGMRTLVSPIANLGLSNSKIVVSYVAKPEKMTQLQMRGSMYLGENPDSPFLLFLKKGAESCSIVATATMLSGLKRAEVAFKLPAIPLSTDGSVMLKDKAGDGPSLFIAAQRKGVSNLLSFGARLPLSICVRDCSQPETKEVIIFQGEVGMELGATSMSIVARLEMTAVWWEAIVPFLHLLYGKITVGFDLKVMLPTRLEVGAMACIGSRAACKENKSENFVRAGLFGGLDANVPARNYMMVMISELTIGKIFGILGETVSHKFQEWLDGMPEALRDSGIYPLKNCSLADKKNPLMKDCYALMSISPVGPQKIKTSFGLLIIENGIRLRGKLDLFGWNIIMDAKIAIANTWFPTFYVDAYCDPIKLGSILQVGRSISDMSTGPRFYIDLGYTAPLTAAVMIKGAYKIPALLTEGSTSIELGKEGFAFNGYSKIMGTVTSNFTAKWSFNFDRFLVAGNISVGGAAGAAGRIANGILTLIHDALKLVTQAADIVARKLDSVREDAVKTLRDAKSFCDTFEGAGFLGDWTKAACGAALDGVIAVVNVAFETVKRTISGAAAAIKAIPMKAIESYTKTSMAALNAATPTSELTPSASAMRSIVSLLDNIFNLKELSFSVKLDNGNLEAGLKVLAKIFGVKLDVDFRCKLNIKLFAKRVWDKAMAWFTHLPQEIMKKCTKLFSDAKNAVSDLMNGAFDEVKKAVGAIKDGVMAAIKWVGDAGKAVIGAAGDVFSRRRRSTRRRYGWEYMKKEVATCNTAYKDLVAAKCERAYSPNSAPRIPLTPLKPNVECKSSDSRVGKFDTLEECAQAASLEVDPNGDKYFVYGTGSKKGECYIEHTRSLTCPEGWKSNSYDFYILPKRSSIKFTRVNEGLE